MQSSLIIATRESRLALWQAHHVRDLLQSTWGCSVGLLGLSTRGDQILNVTLAKIGGKGLFVKELETALLEGRAHLAVHSLKDVPMELPPGLVLAASLAREDPRDAWVSNRFASWSDLPAGATVGTSSLRRLVQIKALRPDLNIQPLRGNLDTRLRKLDDSHYDGIVLAVAGLKRLGLQQRIRAVFSIETLLPCAGQGALGIEVCSADTALCQALSSLSDWPTWWATQAERAVSRALGGSCSIPLAAHAIWLPQGLELRALLGHSLDALAPLLKAQRVARVTDDASAQALGEKVAADLIAAGALSYLKMVD